MRTLKHIGKFYENNKDEIDGYPPIYTLDFLGNETPLRYTKAKIVDMVAYGWGIDTTAEREAMNRATKLS